VCTTTPVPQTSQPTNHEGVELERSLGIDQLVDANIVFVDGQGKSLPDRDIARQRAQPPRALKFKHCSLEIRQLA